ncbi:hypothetical protein ACXYUI_31730, partial [Klebsiella pneumoniae]
MNTLHYVAYFINHRFTALRERFELDLEKINGLDIAFYTRNLDVAFLRPVLGDQLFSITSAILESDSFTCKIECQMT